MGDPRPEALSGSKAPGPAGRRWPRSVLQELLLALLLVHRWNGALGLAVGGASGGHRFRRHQHLVCSPPGGHGRGVPALAVHAVGMDPALMVGSIFTNRHDVAGVFIYTCTAPALAA